METVAFIAGVATVLSSLQLLPQLARSIRLRSTTGLSPAWAAIGGVVNVGWCGYRWAQELWLSLLSPVIAGGLYFLLLWLVLRTSPQRRSAILAASVVAASMAIAGALGNWPMVGATLAVWGGVQVTPAVWSAFRAEGPGAIAPGLWIVGLGQAGLWGYYGNAVGDTALLLYGIATSAGSLAILSLFVIHRNRSKQVAESPQPAATQWDIAQRTPGTGAQPQPSQA